jgi:hypothetical protein
MTDISHNQGLQYNYLKKPFYQVFKSILMQQTMVFNYLSNVLVHQVQCF